MNITAIPDGHTYTLECDECGPLGVVERILLHSTAHLHLHDHGIETPPMTLCACGYDYTHITGHEKDTATCSNCDWVANGIYADHNAHHHHLDTKHPWTLTMGNR